MVLPEAAPALLAYIAVRLVGLIVLWIFARHAGADFWHLLNGRFDSAWYRQVVDRGYDAAIPFGPDGRLGPSNLAFFPLYPALVALLSGITRLSSAVTALAVSWLGGLAAAWGLYAIGRHLGSPRVGIMLAILWGAIPHAIVENMAYTETLFTALAAWSLLAVLRAHWLTAGTLCLLAGLTRPTASVLIATTGLAALMAIIQRRDGLRPWVALLLAPLGYLGYLAWVGLRLGRLDGFFHVQRVGWSMSFDAGAYTLRFAGRILTQPARLELYVITASLALAVALFVLGVLDRQPWPLLVYSGVGILLVLGTAGSYHSKARYLLPLFPLLVPIANGLVRARPETRAMVVVTATLSSAWYGAYLTLIWTLSP